MQIQVSVLTMYFFKVFKILAKLLNVIRFSHMFFIYKILAILRAAACVAMPLKEKKNEFIRNYCGRGHNISRKFYLKRMNVNGMHTGQIYKQAIYRLVNMTS